MAIEKGQTFTGSEKVDKYRPIYYAGASGDYNPIHIDPEFGKMVGLGWRDPPGIMHTGLRGENRYRLDRRSRQTEKN